MVQRDIKDKTTYYKCFDKNIYNYEKKRTNIYQFLKNKTSDTMLLQETHSTKENENKWQNEWKGLSVWHSGTKPKLSGVATLIMEQLNNHITIIFRCRGKNNLPYLFI